MNGTMHCGAERALKGEKGRGVGEVVFKRMRGAVLWWRE
jgi:hypothetical protein